MKLRIAVVLILLGAFISSTLAQTNCCYIQPGSQSTANTPATVAPSNGKSGGTYTGSATQTTIITCYNNSTGKTCLTAAGTTVTSPNNLVTATGSYGYDSQGNFIACNPTFASELGVQQSTSMSTPSSWTNWGTSFTGYDANAGACIANPAKSSTMSTCQAVACPTSGGGTDPGPICGGGGGVGGDALAVQPDELCAPSPIVLDVDGKGYFLTSAENGVKFDISGTGHAIQMGWTAQGADNAFLALPDANGQIHSGKQLFGNFTPQPPSKTPNGFAALAVYDLPTNGGNGDGIIDKRDAIFTSLRLWIDRNHDGIAQPDEIYTLPALGINSISLNYTLDRKTDQYGNQFRYRARLNPDKPDDAGKIVYDIFFVTLDPKLMARLCALPIMVPGKH